MEIVTSEFMKTVEDLTANLQSKDFSDVEEFKLAKKYSALPIGVDLFSYIFLTSNGEVIWDDNEGEIGNSNDLQGLIRVLVVGKSRYPQLETFIPNRSEQSKTCPVCEGSGIWKESKNVVTGKPGKCVVCANLGWVTDECYEQVISNHKSKI
jgi:hypothetical protein